MIGHAWRAVPWSILAVGTGVIPVLLVLVEGWPYTLWPLQGAAVGLLAGTAAWCFDEPAAAVVDTTPRDLRWRTVARSTGVVALLVVWTVVVAATSDGYFGHARDVAVQGFAAVLAMTAYVTWRRSHGVATPARGVSAAVVTVALFMALARPFADQLPVFPYADEGWQASRILWAVIAVGSVAVLASLGRGSPVRADNRR